MLTWRIEGLKDYIPHTKRMLFVMTSGSQVLAVRAVATESPSTSSTSVNNSWKQCLLVLRPEPIRFRESATEQNV